MKVLFLPSFYKTPINPLSGIFFRDQARALVNRGIRVDIVFLEPRSLHDLSLEAICENYFQLIEEDDDGILTIRRKGWNSLLSTTIGGLVWSVLTKKIVANYVNQYGPPDLIHAHNVLWAGYAAYLVSCELRIPYIITEHSSVFLLNNVKFSAKKYIFKAYQASNRVIAVSNSLAKSLHEYSDGREIEIVPNVVDTNFFNLPEISPPREPFMILAASNINQNKGLNILLQAFKRAFNLQPNVFLTIAGDGPQKNQLQTLAYELGISHQVKFLGYLNRNEIRNAMWKSHVFVLSSFKETFGVVLIEAMSTGLPVIATRSGGPEDIIIPEVGLLVEPGNVEEMSEALRHMYSHEGFSRNKLRMNVIDRYSEACIGTKLEGIYKNVISSY